MDIGGNVNTSRPAGSFFVSSYVVIHLSLGTIVFNWEATLLLDLFDGCVSAQ